MVQVKGKNYNNHQLLNHQELKFHNEKSHGLAWIQNAFGGRGYQICYHCHPLFSNGFLLIQYWQMLLIILLPYIRF